MNIKRAVGSGVAATAVMSAVAIMAPMMGMPKMDFGEMLGTNNPMMEVPYVMGWMLHFLVGVLLAIVYAVGVVDRLSGAYVFRGVVFAMVPFVIAQSVMMPMMGSGFWSGGDLMMITGSLVGHVVFGAVLGAVYRSVD